MKSSFLDKQVTTQGDKIKDSQTLASQTIESAESLTSDQFYTNMTRMFCEYNQAKIQVSYLERSIKELEERLEKIPEPSPYGEYLKREAEFSDSDSESEDDAESELGRDRVINAYDSLIYHKKSLEKKKVQLEDILTYIARIDVDELDSESESEVEDDSEELTTPKDSGILFKNTPPPLAKSTRLGQEELSKLIGTETTVKRELIFNFQRAYSDESLISDSELEDELDVIGDYSSGRESIFCCYA